LTLGFDQIAVNYLTTIIVRCCWEVIRKS